MVFAAGGTGATLRVALVPVLDERLAKLLPAAGTLCVNVVGCFLIGLGSMLLPPASTGVARSVVLGGLLGGFTTYSAFGLLSFDLARDGRYTAFAAQLVLHVGLGLAAVVAGVAVGRAAAATTT